MKVSDLQVGLIYRITDDPRIGGTMGATPLEEASRLALYVLRKHAQVSPVFAKPGSTWSHEALIYLGPKRVYGGMNGDAAHYERVHHFVRPNGKRLYIYGQHIKHIRPFTRA